MESEEEAVGAEGTVTADEEEADVLEIDSEVRRVRVGLADVTDETAANEVCASLDCSADDEADEKS